MMAERISGWELDKKRKVAQTLYILAAGAILYLIIGPLGWVGSYASHVINLIMIYAISTLSISMLANYAGIWSIGHTAFLAIGAYLAANLSVKGYPVEVIVLIGFVLSLIIGIVIGLSAGRFSTLYMAILTLALSLVASEVIGRWHSVTGGDQGIIVGQATISFLSVPIRSTQNVLLTVVLATICFAAVTLITKGGWGKRWLAVKNQRMASMAIGLKPSIENAFSFGVSGAITSVAGVALAYSMMYISLEAFTLAVATNLLLCSVIGGVGSIGGALLGSMFLVLVPELAREVKELQGYVFGVATLLILLFLPTGIVPGVSKWMKRRAKNKTVSPSELAAAAKEHVQDEAYRERLHDMIGKLLKPADAQLKISGLGVSFGGNRALDQVRLDVPAGSVVGLIGPNGAGKTTLLNVLSGYVKPTDVEALTFGKADFTALNPYERIRYGFGRTFQHAELFSELTIEDNILLAAKMSQKMHKSLSAKEAIQVAEQLIDELRLRPYAKLYPKEVPFGVQKVTDIVRALATGAQIFVMDEPFSGLDADERKEVRMILESMKKAGVSILIIDHVVQEVLNIADHMVVLNFGSILATGKPEEIKNNPKVLEAYLGSALQDGMEVMQA